ncbi:MAG: PLP-dependent cysteine synthase family protein, partial [Actinomycetia bacterium]|nr:PLP-dependent cysteine synthase family protein [Actinomycetes bacterium]
MPDQLFTFDDVDRSDADLRGWVAERVRRLEADAQRSADTHLLQLELPQAWGIDLYLKDESTHPTGSLKHRLARSLFMYALVNGHLRPGSLVVEASSGSTAVSEAHFARILDLPFVAVLPRGTSAEKIRLIEAEGGRVHVVERADQMCTESRRLAREHGGYFLDQFTFAERATDWRGNNNIAQSIYDQLSRERHPVPAWIVVGAGTGGTSATLGRFLRYHKHPTSLCVADVEGSAFFDGWVQSDPGLTVDGSSRIEGIGRPRVEPSFVLGVVDRMMRVPDAASVAGCRFASARLGRLVGASTGTNLVAVARLVT